MHRSVILAEVNHALQTAPHRSPDSVSFSPLTAVSYVRVSTTRQVDKGGERDGFSIPAQREANRRQAHGLGALISVEFIDRGRSGPSSNRPELQRMPTYIRRHTVDYVIVHKLDRLAQSRTDDVAITQAIEAAGARLVSINQGHRYDDERRPPMRDHDVDRGVLLAQPRERSHEGHAAESRPRRDTWPGTDRLSAGRSTSRRRDPNSGDCFPLPRGTDCREPP